MVSRRRFRGQAKRQKQEMSCVPAAMPSSVKYARTWRFKSSYSGVEDLRATDTPMRPTSIAPPARPKLPPS